MMYGLDDVPSPPPKYAPEVYPFIFLVTSFLFENQENENDVAAIPDATHTKQNNSSVIRLYVLSLLLFIV